MDVRVLLTPAQHRQTKCAGLHQVDVLNALGMNAKVL